MEGRRCDDEVGLRVGVSVLPAFFHQEPPLEHDVLGDFEDALLEHRPHLVREPVVECCATGGIHDELDAEAYLGEADGAHIETLEGLSRHEAHDLPLRLWAAELGQHVGVEEPAAHGRSMSRTGIRVRLGSSSISRDGEACIAATSAAPVTSPLRRRNSSSATTTTPSRPRTVTCCGPSLRARRTTSLRRALAS